MFGKTKKFGEALIAEVTGKFEDLVAQLESGVADCQSEQNDIKVQIEELSTRDMNLTNTVSRGRKMAGKLRDLTGMDAG